MTNRTPIRRAIGWSRTRWKRCVGVGLLVAFVALNALAYLHAGSMTRFVESGTKTRRPEDLAFLDKLQVLVRGVRIPRPVNRRTPADSGLGFSTHRVASGDGVTLDAWHIPAPNPKGLVVLFHGYTSCKQEVIEEAVAFREQGFETLLVDFRGSGGSTGTDTTIGYHEAEDVAHIVDYARSLAENRPLVLFGASMGAAAVLRAVGEFDVRADALVLEAPFDRLLSTARSRFAALGAPSFPCAQLLVFWGGYRCGFDGFAHNPVDYARGVSVPTLLLRGARDDRVTEQQASSILDAMTAPTRLANIPGAGHDRLLRHDRIGWTATVVAFLAEHIPGSPDSR